MREHGRAARAAARRATASIQLEAPSSRAASTSERGTERKNARIQNVPNATDSADLRAGSAPSRCRSARRRAGRSRAARSIASSGTIRPSSSEVEEHLLAAEAHHAEGVAGQDREHGRDRDDAHGDDGARAQVGAEVALLPGVGEVGESEAAGSPTTPCRRVLQRRQQDPAIGHEREQREDARARRRSRTCSRRSITSRAPRSATRLIPTAMTKITAARRARWPPRRRPAPVAERALVDLEARAPWWRRPARRRW